MFNPFVDLRPRLAVLLFAALIPTRQFSLVALAIEFAFKRWPVVRLPIEEQLAVRLVSLAGCFQHIQAIVSEANGIDKLRGDWA
ncbi:MAG: hypothetical protein ACJATP_000120 [Candidatus Azotimanducaceae bacterium]